MNRKLKIDKSFKPSEAIEADEIYPNGIFVFNISRLIEFIDSNPDLFIREKKQVKEIYKYSSNLNEPHLEKVDITKPAIFGEIAPGRYNLIDGHHRVEKARRLGVKEISFYKVDIEYLRRFFTSDEAYKAHIAYWNDKQKE